MYMCRSNNARTRDSSYLHVSPASSFRRQGTSDKLLEHLVEDHTFADPMYIEDFLLSARVFLKQPERVMEKCIEWYRYAVCNGHYII